MVQATGNIQFAGRQSGFTRLSYQAPGLNIQPVSPAAKLASRKSPASCQSMPEATTTVSMNHSSFITGRNPSITCTSSAEMPGSDSAWPAIVTMRRSQPRQPLASRYADSGGQIMS